METYDVLMTVAVCILIAAAIFAGIFYIDKLNKSEEELNGNYMELVAIDDDTGFRYFRDMVTDHMYLRYRTAYELITKDDGTPLLYDEWLQMWEGK